MAELVPAGPGWDMAGSQEVQTLFPEALSPPGALPSSPAWSTWLCTCTGSLPHLCLAPTFPSICLGKSQPAPGLGTARH